MNKNKRNPRGFLFSERGILMKNITLNVEKEYDCDVLVCG